MKKAKKKNIIILVLSILLLFAICLNFISLRKTITKEQSSKELEKELNYVSVLLTSEEKINFSKEKDMQYLERKGKGEISTITDGTIEEFISKRILKSMPNIDLNALEEYGIYTLKTAVNNKRVDEDIELSKPYVFYNAVDHTWIVTTWGRWLTNNWNHGIVSRELGDKSQFGVYHSGIDGLYDTCVMNSIGYITDGVEEKSKHTTSRAGGIIDDRAVGEGFYFELQDYTYGLIKKKYVGEKWYCSCTYDEAYEKFGGEITSHYRP